MAGSWFGRGGGLWACCLQCHEDTNADLCARGNVCCRGSSWGSEFIFVRCQDNYFLEISWDYYFCSAILQKWGRALSLKGNRHRTLLIGPSHLGCLQPKTPFVRTRDARTDFAQSLPTPPLAPASLLAQHCEYDGGDLPFPAWVDHRTPSFRRQYQRDNCNFTGCQHKHR
jgi:hypothetical protein